MWLKRLNKGSMIVLYALEQANKLCSVQEICHWLKETHPEDAPALTTVYRAIENLLTAGLIQAVDLGDGEKRYERIEEGHHHHHLICSECQSSIHLDQCFLESISTKVEQAHGFRVTSHVLEIFGTCKDCLEQQNNKGKQR